MKAIFLFMSICISFSSWGHSGDSRPHTQHTDSQCYNLIVGNNQPGERVCPPGVEDTPAGAQDAGQGTQQTASPETITLQGENGESIVCNVVQNGNTSSVACPNQEQRAGRSQAQRCVAALNGGRLNYKAAERAPMPGRTELVQAAAAQLEQQKFCRQLEIASVANGSSLNSGSDQAASIDRRIICQKVGGYTLDWQSCKNGVNAYNIVFGADKALDMVQQVQAQQNSQKLGEEYAKAAQEGAGQDAAYEAMVQERRKMASMQDQKAVAYVAAVAALGNSIMRWQGKSPGAVQRLCSGFREEGGHPADRLPQEACPNALVQVKDTAGVFANDNGKAALVMAFMEYMAKAIKAKMDANQLRNIAKQISDVKNDVQDLGPTTFERCSIAPNDPACQQAGGPRIPGQEYVGGEISIGENFNNAFGDSLQETPNVGFETDDLTPGESVASSGNPFEDAAREASGILEEAPAANVQPGSAPGGGGGGGAGGGLGGGGVSLGNDLKGPEAEKTAEVKADGVGGKYNFAGGGGFQAIKQGKDDANPFASLFDSKSQGGVEQDRTFASDDIGGKDSGLFLRISKRYGKISGEKRIEATNLE